MLIFCVSSDFLMFLFSCILRMMVMHILLVSATPRVAKVRKEKPPELEESLRFVESFDFNAMKAVMNIPNCTYTAGIFSQIQCIFHFLLVSLIFVKDFHLRKLITNKYIITKFSAHQMRSASA